MPYLTEDKIDPIKGQKILIDTNVIYWLTYASSRSFPKALKPLPYQTEKYPRIFEKLVNNDNVFFFSNYSISELTNIITRTEAGMDSISNKHDIKNWLRKGGREEVLEELTTSLEALESWSSPLESEKPLSTKDYTKRFSEVFLDGYDINIEKEMKSNNIKYILTDDIDFNSVDYLYTITANRSIK